MMRCGLFRNTVNSFSSDPQPKQIQVKVKCIAILQCAAVMSLSCARSVTADTDVLPYIRNVLADTSSVAYSVLAGYDPADRYGSIAVAGPEESTRQLAAYLMACDMFDNIDARESRDSLPDFAGELFASCYDLADTSYAGLVRDGKDDALREVTVRNAVAAAAGECYQNAFSNVPSVEKSPAKIIVFSSSFSEVGTADVDTLFSLFGKTVRLVSPVEAIAQRIEEEHVAGKIGIWADNDVLASGVYARVFRNWNRGFDYVGFSPDGFSTAEEGFFRFLDMYMSTGEVVPLSAVVIDDFRLSGYAASINEVASRVRSSTTDEHAVYRAILADDFKVIDAVSSIARSCYRTLRKENLFTHIIRYPLSEEYAIVRSPEANADIKYIEYNHIYVH